MGDQAQITHAEGCSPLEQIRSAEMEVARRTAAARQAAEELLVQSQQQVADLRREAEEKGRQEGQAQYVEAVSRAQDAAQAIVAPAHQQADGFRRQAEDRMDSLVRAVVELIAGAGEDER